MLTTGWILPYFGGCWVGVLVSLLMGLSHVICWWNMNDAVLIEEEDRENHLNWKHEETQLFYPKSHNLFLRQARCIWQHRSVRLTTHMPFLAVEALTLFAIVKNVWSLIFLGSWESFVLPHHGKPVLAALAMSREHFDIYHLEVCSSLEKCCF